MPFILRKTLSETYLQRIRTTPDAIGFQYKPSDPEEGPPSEWKLLSFQQFDLECRKVSYGLMNLGIKPGDKVAILAQPRFEWVLCDLAILGAGAVTVPVYSSLTAEDCAFIIDHSEARIAIIDDATQLAKLVSLRSALPKLERIVVIDPFALISTANLKDVLSLRALKEIGRREEGKDPARYESNLVSARPADLLTLCYTSGTTGRPKGAMITHDNMMSVLEDCVKSLTPLVQPEHEVLVNFLPFSHVLGKVELMATFTFGWRECFSESPDKLVANIAELKPTLLFAVPRLFEKARERVLKEIQEGSGTQRTLFEKAFEQGVRYFANREARRKIGLIASVEHHVAQQLVFKKIRDRFGGKLKAVICGGAPLSHEVATFFQVAGVPILEGYGLTETCAPVSVNTPRHFRLGSVGRPLPEVSIKIASDGEILIKSRKVFAGYFKSPEETQEALRDGWLHTGDIGHLDSDGFLKITDRKKDLIATSGGKKIAPQKIEGLLKAQPYVSQAVAHGDMRNYLTALVTLDHPQLIAYAQAHDILFSDFAGLISHPKVQVLVQKTIDEVNQKLAPYEMIRKFIILPLQFTIESGELTPSLKIRRNFVNQKYKAELDSMYSP